MDLVLNLTFLPSWLDNGKKYRTRSYTISGYRRYNIPDINPIPTIGPSPNITIQLWKRRYDNIVECG